jgi:hypothetical protein
METDNIEYRLVWPNHEVYTDRVLPENIDLVENVLRDTLRKVGVPEQYWPHREARVLKTIVSEGVWEPPAAAKSRLKNPGNKP